MIIILTDLDGTLLDAETYSYQPAAGGLQTVADRGIPLVIMSSKTRSEIEFLRRDLDNRHPFVSENGGALFIPDGYFPFSIPYTRKIPEYLVVDIGVPYASLTSFLDKMIRDRSLPVRGFHSLSVEEIARLAGLPVDSAARAKDREYDEPFLFGGTGKEWEILKKLASADGLTLTRGGRFHHLSGPHDKGTAARVLIEWYRHRYPDALFVGLGDAANDLPFLGMVDRPVLVRKPDGTSETVINIPGISYTRHPGPAGWNEAVLALIYEDRS